MLSNLYKIQYIIKYTGCPITTNTLNIPFVYKTITYSFVCTQRIAYMIILYIAYCIHDNIAHSTLHTGHCTILCTVSSCIQCTVCNIVVYAICCVQYYCVCNTLYAILSCVQYAMCKRSYRQLFCRQTKLFLLKIDFL